MALGPVFLSERHISEGQTWLSIPITLWQAFTIAIMAWNPCLTSAWLKKGLRGRLCVRFIRRTISLRLRDGRPYMDQSSLLLKKSSSNNYYWLHIFHSAILLIVSQSRLFEPWNSPWLLSHIFVRCDMLCHFSYSTMDCMFMSHQIHMLKF